MIGVAQRYNELLTTLLVERELAGGTLSEEEESRFVEELDRCWWALTPEEQDAIERAAPEQRDISAPISLAEEDVALLEGARTRPRRAA
jgi:hypothetical protein